MQFRSTDSLLHSSSMVSRNVSSQKYGVCQLHVCKHHIFGDETFQDSDSLKQIWQNVLKLLRYYGKPCFSLSFHIEISAFHDDVIKWKYFPCYWPFVRGTYRWHKGQWRGALIFSLICAWMNGWDNHREAGDFRRHRAYYDGTVMF